MTTRLSIQPRKALIILLSIALLMSVLAVVGILVEMTFDVETDGKDGNPYIWPIVRQFSFVEEGNIANFYQGLQLVFASVLLLVIWRGKVQRREPFRGHWLVLAGIFLFLGMDEIAQIHETTIAIEIVTYRGHEGDKTSWFWVYLPLAAIFGLSYLRFLRRLPRRIAGLMMASGMIYIMGVVVLEKFVNWYAGKHSDGSIGYLILDNLSEFTEGAGIALFIYTLLTYLAETGEEIAFRLTQTPDRERASG